MFTCIILLVAVCVYSTFRLRCVTPLCMRCELRCNILDFLCARASEGRFRCCFFYVCLRCYIPGMRFCCVCVGWFRVAGLAHRDRMDLLPFKGYIRRFTKAHPNNTNTSGACDALLLLRPLLVCCTCAAAVVHIYSD